MQTTISAAIVEGPYVAVVVKRRVCKLVAEGHPDEERADDTARSTSKEGGKEKGQEGVGRLGKRHSVATKGFCKRLQHSPTRLPASNQAPEVETRELSGMGGRDLRNTRKRSVVKDVLKEQL